MRNKIMIMALMLGLSATIAACADQKSTSTPTAAPNQVGKIMEVGNKICPVSDEKVGGMGDIVQIEYNGKIYNLCCPMCKKDFNKDPEKYSKIADDEVAASAQEVK